MKNLFYTALVGFSIISCNAQNANSDAVILKIAGEEVSKGEFERVYYKNNTEEVRISALLSARGPDQMQTRCIFPDRSQHLPEREGEPYRLPLSQSSRCPGKFGIRFRRHHKRNSRWTCQRQVRRKGSSHSESAPCVPRQTAVARTRTEFPSGRRR